VTGLARSARGHDAILVFVDRLTKYVHLVATTARLSAEGFAKLFVRHVFANHGMPSTVVSDRGTQWNSHFWRHVCRALHVTHLMSSANHPETDGQTERVNHVLKEILSAYATTRRIDWDEWLPLVQFAIDNSWQESIGTTPSC
jgi:transposase InsO family protein